MNKCVTNWVGNAAFFLPFLIFPKWPERELEMKLFGRVPLVPPLKGTDITVGGSEHLKETTLPKPWTLHRVQDGLDGL